MDEADPGGTAARTRTPTCTCTAATVRADDGVRLWAARTGGGAPLILCHGGPGLWDTLDDVAHLLAGTSAVHRWDQRGAGRSEHRGPYSVARSLADLDAVRGHFGLDRVALLGHSWGAQLALSYALAHPERVSALVYVGGTGIDPTASWSGPAQRALRERLGPHLDRWAELGSRPRTPAEDREFCVLQWSTDFADRGRHRGRALEQAERMATPWYGVNFACNKAINAENRREWGTPALRDQVAALTVPTLIVDGALDPRPRTSVDSLEQALPAVTRVTLAGAAHLPWTESPAAFRTAVTGFLATAR